MPRFTTLRGGEKLKCLLDVMDEIRDMEMVVVLATYMNIVVMMSIAQSVYNAVQ